MFGIRLAAHRHQQLLGCQLLLLAVAQRDADLAARRPQSGRFPPSRPVSTRILFFRNTRSSSFEISSSSTGTMRGSISRTVTSVPKRLKTEANSTPTAPAPMIASVLRNRGEIQNFDVGQDALGVGLQARQHARFRSRRQQDVLRLERLRPLLAASLPRCPSPFSTRVSLDPFDLVLLHQELDALGMLGDDLVLAVDDLRDNRGAASRKGCPLLRSARNAPRHPPCAAGLWSECSPRAGTSRPSLGSFSMIAVFRPYCPARTAAE